MKPTRLPAQDLMLRHSGAVALDRYAVVQGWQFTMPQGMPNYSTMELFS